ncbi:MAG: Alpha/beta hydrolase [Hyphomicrobiales bacterium]|nr:Alpha/beta hydrolase [Hyphomicrobiales bacterium]
MTRDAAPETYFVRAGEASIWVRAQGAGPLVALLPSQARDSDDYDDIAQGFAAAGYRVLRPQPRGIGRSAGPLDGLTLRDLAHDVAEVIRAAHAGPAIIVGHAFGHYVARMVATAFPDVAKGVVVAASAAKTYPADLSRAVTQAGDVTLPDDVRLAALRQAFFAPGNDPRCWLAGWHPHMQAVQRAARAAVEQESYWAAGDAPLLDLQAEFDPFKPPERRMEMREDFGERVSIALIRNASHALIPEQPDAVVSAVCDWMRRIGHR